MNRSGICLLMAIVTVLAGCSSNGHRAPIVDRSGADRDRAGVASTAQTTNKTAASTPRETDWRPEVYVVQKGDTLYSIAFNYGFDYHELAELNDIKDPTMIFIGQKIRLFPNRTNTAASPPPITRTVEPPIKDQPKLVKYAYSEAALAQIEKVQAAPRPPVAEAPKPVSEPAAAASGSVDDVEDAELEWNMPAQGKLIAGFSESSNNKGIDIAGKRGDPVIASAPGKVVYSGSGLRGYGKLVIIKHNKTFLSAYAHNDKVLVKEGQSVTRGQKIAAMGSTDTNQVKLHFEIRRFGKPVDPAKYLPAGKP